MPKFELRHCWEYEIEEGKLGGKLFRKPPDFHEKNNQIAKLEGNMANFEVEGKIVHIDNVVSGQSARGAWSKQDFVVEFQEGKFPSNVALTAWGEEKVAELAKFKVDSQVKVSFNINAREFKGRWYNELRAWRISAVGNEPAQPKTAYEPYDMPPPPPAPLDSDDLPF